MAKVIITLEDNPDGTVQYSMEFEPIITQATQYTPAIEFGIDILKIAKNNIVSGDTPEIEED